METGKCWVLLDTAQEGIKSDVEKEWTERVSLAETAMLREVGSGDVAVDVDLDLSREEEGWYALNECMEYTEFNHDGFEIVGMDSVVGLLLIEKKSNSRRVCGGLEGEAMFSNESVGHESK